MAPRSLLEMCTRVAIDNISGITSLNNMPAKTVSELLRAVKSAHHLHQLELESDSIYDETPYHWRRIIKKDFPSLEKQKQWVPSNPTSWYKVWLKYKKENDASIAAATAILSQTFAAEKKQKESGKSAILSVSQAKNLPGHTRAVARGPSQPHWSTKPRTKTTPLSKITSQVRAESGRRNLSTKTLAVRRTQITKAPESMVRDRRVERQFDPASTPIRAPRARPTPTTGRDEQERREREARLLRIKSAGKTVAKSNENVIDVDDDDDDDSAGEGGGDLEDLFGDLEAAAASPPKTSRYTATVPEASRSRRGLLSAAPGSSKVTRVPSSPPKALAGSASPPTMKPATHPTLAAMAGTPPPAAAAPPTFVKRKGPVDIFMRPNKRPRH